MYRSGLYLPPDGLPAGFLGSLGFGFCGLCPPFAMTVLLWSDRTRQLLPGEIEEGDHRLPVTEWRAASSLRAVRSGSTQTSAVQETKGAPDQGHSQNPREEAPTNSTRPTLPNGSDFLAAVD